MCLMPRGRGDRRPRSGGADVSRTLVDHGKGRGRSYTAGKMIVVAHFMEVVYGISEINKLFRHMPGTKSALNERLFITG